MSVKPPKAEVARRWWHFRFVPRPDTGGSQIPPQFGLHDAGAGEETRLEVPNTNKDPPLGATLGYSGEAHADAKEQVKLFLSQNLSAK